MMTAPNGNKFHVAGLLLGESTDDRWIPLTMASGAELWCLLWFEPKQVAEQAIAGDLRRQHPHYDVIVMTADNNGLEN